MTTITVPVELTKDQYRALVLIADEHGTQVHRLLANLAAAALSNGPRTPPKAGMTVDQQICAMFRDGKRDREIAASLGLKTETVARVRRSYGLRYPQGRKRGGKS